jgi:hypothetical protein
LQTIFNEAPDALIVIMKKAILSDGTQKPNKFWMVIDRGFRKINCRIDHARKIQRNIAVGFKNFLKTGEATVLIKPWKLLQQKKY